MDLRLDTTTHDLVIGSDGELETVDTEEEIEQRVRITFRCWAPEYVFNTAFGVPYRELVLRRDPDLPEIDARLRAIAASVPGVNRLIASAPTYDADARTYSNTITVDTEYGPIPADLVLGLE